jgi:hypothetical protein
MLEIIISLGLLAILSLPIYRVYIASVRFTEYSGEKIEASNFGLSLVAVIEAGSSPDINNNDDLNSEFEVQSEGQNTYRISPKDDQPHYALVDVEQATGSPYTIPRANFDLALDGDSHLYRASNELYLIEVQVMLRDELIATYLTSDIE